MSPQDTPSGMNGGNSSEMDADQNNDSLANKLSQELNNWRRRRTTTARSKRNEPVGAMSSSSQSDSARTIRVRGHETLVIRKPKMVVKPSHATDRSDQ
jgi:hypothetical protein